MHSLIVLPSHPFFGSQLFLFHSILAQQLCSFAHYSIHFLSLFCGSVLLEKCHIPFCLPFGVLLSFFLPFFTLHPVVFWAPHHETVSQIAPFFHPVSCPSSFFISPIISVSLRIIPLWIAIDYFHATFHLSLSYSHLFEISFIFLEKSLYEMQNMCYNAF